MAEAEKEYLLIFETEEDFQRAKRFVVRSARHEHEPEFEPTELYNFLGRTPRRESSVQFHRWPLCSTCKEALEWYFKKVLQKESPVKGVCMEYL